MPAYSHTQILGFIGDVVSALEKVRTALRKMGVDDAVLVAQIELLREQTVSLNAQQEALKRQLRATTTAYEATLHSLYVTGSGALDTAIAAVRKDSDDAKNLRRVRSRIRAPRKPAQGPEAVTVKP